MSIIAQNKQANYNFFIHESFEMGIVLLGTEVKSIREGKINFKDSYVYEKSNELWLKGVHISEYTYGNILNHIPERDRKLLAHRKEINKIIHQMREKNYTLVPIDFHYKNEFIKIQIGLATGKKQYDKRNSIQKRDTSREIKRTIKNFNLKKN